MEYVLEVSGKAMYERMIESQMNYNIMVRQLSGIEDSDNVRNHIKHRKDSARYGPYQPLTFVVNKYSSIDMDRFLDKAKENLHKISFIGMFTHLERDAMLMSKKFGLPFSPPRKKIGQTKSVFSVDNKCQKYVEELNSYDSQLYKYCLEISKP